MSERKFELGDSTFGRRGVGLKKRRHTHGFSIVELVVAIGVLVLGVYGIFDQFVQVREMGRQRFLMAQARLLAQQKLEELRVCSHADLKAWKPADEFIVLEGQPEFHVKTEVSARTDNSLEITVTVGRNPDDPVGRHFPKGQFLTVKGVRAP